MENHAPSGISARKYLDNQDLNVNSGRRHFAAMAKLEQEGLSYEEISKQLFSKASGASESGSKTKVKSGSKSGSQKKADPLPNKVRSTSNPAKALKNKDSTGGEAEKASPPENKRSKTRTRLTTPLQLEFIDRSSDSQIGNGGRFDSGNTAGVRTAAYLNLVHAQSDIVETVLRARLGDVSGLVKLAEIRYIQMERLLVDRLVDIKVQAKKGLLPKDHEGNERSEADLTREAIWGSSGVMTGLLGTLTMAHTQASKALVDNEIKTYRFDRDNSDRAFMIEIAERRANEEITALTAATLIEARGLSPSPIITAEALKEIELMKPKVDTSGISDAELDALVEGFMQEKTEEVQSMAARSAILERLILQSNAELESDGLEENEFAESAYTGLEDDDVSFEGIEGELLDDDDEDFEWADDPHKGSA
jgi:hypothetical protein